MKKNDIKADSFLSRFLKSLGASEQMDAQTTEAVVEATVAVENTTLQAEFEAYKAETQAQLEEMSKALALAATSMKEADAKVKELQAALDAVAQENELALKAAQEAALQVRREKIEAVVGTDKSAALMAATQNMSDADFETVLGTMEFSAKQESKSKLFSEAGVSAEVDASTVNEETEEMKQLKAKYHKTAKA